MKILSVVGALLLLMFTTTPVYGGSLTFTPSEGPPGTTVTVYIDVDPSPHPDTETVMYLQINADNENNFTVTESIPFDSQGRATFTFVVPDVAADEYHPGFACIGAREDCAREDSPDFRFEGIVFTVTESTDASGPAPALPNSAVIRPSAWSAVGVFVPAAWAVISGILLIPGATRRLIR